MKKTITLLLLIIISTVSFGQRRYKTSLETKDSRATMIKGAIVPDENCDNFVAFVNKPILGRPRHRIRVYNNNLKQIKEIEVEKVEELIETKNKAFMTYFKDKKLVITEIDKCNGEAIGEPKEIFDIEYKMKVGISILGAISADQSFKQSSRKSEDKKLTAFMAKKSTGKYSKTQLSFSVFDEDLNLINSKDLVIDVKSKNYFLKDFRVTNDGDIVFISKDHDGKKRYLHTTLINKDGSILEYDTEIDRIKDSYKKDNKLDVSIVPVEEGFRIIMLQNKKKGIDLTTINLDHNLKEINRKENVITEENINQKGKKRKSPFEADYVINEILFQDNSTLIFTEQAGISVSTTSRTNNYAGPGGSTYTTESKRETMFHCFIMVHSLNNQGEVQWSTLIPKVQTIQGSKFQKGIGYKLLINKENPSKNHSYILYNDHIDNINSGEKIKYFNFNYKLSKKMMKLVILNNDDGKFSEHRFINLEQLNLIPDFEDQYDNDEYLYFWGSRKKQHALVRVNKSEIFNFDTTKSNTPKERTKRKSKRSSSKKESSKKKKRRKKRK